ncbi:XRE family transcriptional regulator [Phormidesmis priestleyi ULC007]|uniref:XRE family transcriptional regulator n=1 Tax=Phormidesmis priestleyi ULC007 TaxID=1920490 RepID=A0A2T1DBJ3_9CYAN|nr:helix-turn-helix transcriptional regulator [Phormidesmis priestleyi]PSB17827.1 XRE family transcriptional regulator [Phormidesmis priestleyi ULC007]PZO46475.1 MAG: XRE family transcriptional regulator [Phormidesmis priestleyi]
MATTSSPLAKPQSEIGIVIRQLRQLLGLTQAQFARKLGVTLPTINRWENNRSQPSSLALMQLKAMLHELKNSPIKFHQVCAQTLLEDYFDEQTEQP